MGKKQFLKIKKCLLFRRQHKENEKPLNRLEVDICNVSTKVLYSECLNSFYNSIITEVAIQYREHGKKIWTELSPKEYIQKSNNYIKRGLT